MADDKAVKVQQSGEKPGARALMVGDLVQAAVAPDGTVTIKEALDSLKLVDVADIDLLLTFANGDHVVVPNGALEALGANPPDAVFSDRKIGLADLFKMVGVVNPAKAGSLRLVTENIDANPPHEENFPPSEPAPQTPPPAPMVKVGTGTGAGKGPGNGVGAGEGEGDVPATVVPLVTAQPAVYRVGKSTQSVQDLLSGTGLGTPNFTATLYTSSEYKVSPSGRTDLPLGAYDPSASTSQLAERASPAKQATVEVINGTSGDDTINFNAAFSSGEGQWSKTLHITINNFSDVASIQLVFNAARIAMIPGFDLQGTGVTRDGPTSNSWHVAPTAAMLLHGLDVNIVYNVNDSAAPVDFGADVIIKGHAGPFDFEVTNNLNLTWRDAVTTADFTVPSLAGDPMLVLPRAGVGVVVNAGDGNDTINSGAGPDIVHGGNGDDAINAGAGNDILDGGVGADVLNGGVGIDTATYENAASGVAASLTTGLAGFSSTGEASGDTYASIENLTGSNFNDTLIGDANANGLSGGAGDDILEGMGGADTLIGGDGNNTASYAHATGAVVASLGTPAINTGDAAGDVYTQIQNLTGSAFNDTLMGDSGSNVLNGGGGDDVLEGMGGADTLIGGAGNNTASYDHATIGVTASLDTPGANTGDATGDTYSQIQNLAGSAFNDTLIGDGGSNTLSGGTGDDVLEGMAGADVLDGGTGADTASYVHASTFVSASLTIGLAGFAGAGDASGDTYASIENLTGSNYNDTLIGDVYANVLNGGTGDDVLEGMGGADTLVGGAGNNTASYAHAGVAVTASLDNPGINTGDATGDTYTQIQNLAGSDYNDTLVGDAGNNILNGGMGDDLLEGMGGADVLNGGATGTDTASYAHAGTFVSASLTTGLSGFSSAGDAVGDTYVSIENLSGSSYNDTLIGDASANVLNGGAGDDVLEGLGGADSLIGGVGNNTASYQHATLAVVASLTNPVTNTGDAGGDTYTNIQNLTGSGFNDTLTGDGGSNILIGGAGDDVLEGFGNSDILDGGSGNDTASYVQATTGVAASMTTGLAGFSSAGDAAGDTYASIENLTGSAFNDTLIGDGNSNVLNGGSGDDILEGLGGADTLIGGTGNNTASYAHGADQGGGLGVTASLLDASTNTGDALGDTYTQIQNLTGSAFNDTLTGDAGNNILDGGDGNDAISGGLGTDALYGGNGNDTLTDDLAGAAKLYGGAGDDTISMTGDDATLDIIDGGTGSDTLVWAYAGSQRVDVNMQAGTVYFYGPVAGTLANFSGIENFTAAGTNNAYVYANNFDNVITGGSTSNDWVDYRYAVAGVNANLATGVVTGGSGNDTLIGFEHLYAGSSFADTLIGDAQDNWIRGGSGGGDYLDGGAGRDTWYIDWNGNSVTASLLTAAQNAAMGIVMTGDAAGDTVVNFERIYSNYGDFLYGDAGHNDLYGRGLIEGFLGNDYIYGFGTTATASYANAGNSYLASQGITSAAGVGVTATLTTSFSVGPAVLATGDAVGDTYAGVVNNLKGSAYADTLIGNGSVNTLDGGAGNDVLEGLGGADVLIGGTGVDTASYVHATAGVVADLSGTFAGTNDAAGDAFFGIENLTGSNFNDSLYGDGNDNVLDGGLGVNLLNGGGGTDTASYASATGAMTINLAAGTVSGAGRTDTLVSIEQVIGSDFNDAITGSTGNDWIDAGVGADTVDGGAGIDTLSYNSATGGVTVTLNGANSQGDTISNFENLFGSTYGDILTGDGNNNVIEGGLGNDSLNGAGGTDTVSYAYSTAAVNVNLSGAVALGIAAASASGGEGTDTLANFENITGSAYNDTLIGDGNANVIDGGNGNDVLVGGAGADTLTGGNGTDTVSYATAASAVAVTINGTGTLGDASGDVLSGIENLVGSAFNDTLTGDGGGNLIDGGAGNDTINGAGGVDTVTYLSAASAVTVNLSSAGVNVSGGAGSDTLTNIENIIGSGFNDTLTGDGGANTIDGGLGNDTLDGAGGVDTVSYDSAAAGISVNISGVAVHGVAANSASGGAGSDTLANFENVTGSAYNDTLIGGTGSNLIDGGAGDDFLIGGIGADTLVGGAGTDTVSYENASSAVQATLGGAVLTHLGDALGDTFSGVENLTGSAYNDILYGDSNNNVLVGGAGDDDLRGYDGNDTLDARLGHDTLRGGNGDDVFLVDVSAANLPTRIYGEGNNSTLFGGGDAVKLYGLVSGATYSLTNLANVTDTSEILDVREGTSNVFNITSLDVRNFVDGGNGSQLWIKADSGDALNVGLVAGETLQTFSVLGGTDYLVFNASSTQVAQIHWQTA